MDKQLDNLRAKLKAAQLELKIRERTKNQSLKGYERIEQRIKELEGRINEVNVAKP